MQQKEQKQKRQPNRGGRPPKAPEDRKTVQMKIWVTPADAEAIKKKTKAEGFKHAGQFMARAVHNAVHGSTPAINFNPVDMRNLAGIGNNINEIAKHLNEGGAYHPEMHEEVLYVGNLCKKLCVEIFKLAGKKPKRRAAK